MQLCMTLPNTKFNALGYIYSFGEHNEKDIDVLASTGVYRVARPSRGIMVIERKMQRNM